MPVLTSALNTVFTPTKTAFNVSVQGGGVMLEARGSATAPWSQAGSIGAFTVVDNPVVGTQYRLVNNTGATAVEVNE